MVLKKDIRKVTLKVERCLDCPFLLQDSNLSYCCKTKTIIDDFLRLHKNCPLEK